MDHLEIFIGDLPFQIVIFHSYVGLPEGNVVVCFFCAKAPSIDI